MERIFYSSEIGSLWELPQPHEFLFLVLAPVKYDNATADQVRSLCSVGLQNHASGVVKLPRQLGL